MDCKWKYGCVQLKAISPAGLIVHRKGIQKKKFQIRVTFSTVVEMVGPGSEQIATDITKKEKPELFLLL